jgi:MFS family permease
LPSISHAFGGKAGMDFKIALVAVGPSLVVGLCSVPYGFLIDRIGRRKLLIAALAFYGAAGLAPLLLTSLNDIITSRLAVGLAEAAVFTASTALISDYFFGAQRDRWMAAQTGFSTVFAVAMVFLGGMLGAHGWRAPFLIYGLAWLFIPPVIMLLFEPANHKTPASDGDPQPPTDFRWTPSILIAIALLVSMIGFMLPLVQFSFLATERGMSSPADIGLWSAIASLGNPLGSLLFVFLKLSAPRKLTLVYALFAAGFLLIGSTTTIPAVILGSIIANVGAGIMFPTMITWLLSSLPSTVRGRGSGLFTTAVFLGQFAGPMAILGVEHVTGSLTSAVFTIGAVCALVAMATMIGILVNRSPPGASRSAPTSASRLSG